MPEHVNILRKGPADNCPACKAQADRFSDGIYRDASPLDRPRACGPDQRIATGLFRKCEVEGEHLHEYCKVCKFAWLSEFAEKA